MSPAEAVDLNPALSGPEEPEERQPPGNENPGGNENSSPDCPDCPGCPHREIVALYHETLPELPAVKVWHGDREKNLRARWRERWKAQKFRTQPEGIAYFRKLFGFLRESDFLMGRTADREGRSFFASLDWIVKPNNFAKIIEGRYHRQESAA